MRESVFDLLHYQCSLQMDSSYHSADLGSPADPGNPADLGNLDESWNLAAGKRCVAVDAGLTYRNKPP